MKIFGVLLAAVLVMVSGTAFAGMDCKSPDGKTTVMISNYWLTGPSADFQSQEVSDYYAEKFGLKVGKLETSKDLKTQKYISETKQNANGEIVTTFLEGTPGLAAWGLEVNQTTKTAILRDQEGRAFSFSLICTQTPELE